MVTLVARGDDVHVDAIGTMTLGSDEPTRIHGEADPRGGDDMAVAVAPGGSSPVPGRSGWSGVYGTTWFNRSHR